MKIYLDSDFLCHMSAEGIREVEIDAYEIRAKVSHNNKYWVNEYPANIYELGIFGWVIQENN